MSKNKYQPGGVVDLDDVAISPAAFQAWQTIAQAGALALPPHIRPGDIPDEQGLWLASGELEIFVEVPGLARISMEIPPGQWSWRHSGYPTVQVSTVGIFYFWISSHAITASLRRACAMWVRRSDSL